jgi:phosphosulfolactate phosphohydrolase-like enzyme
MKVAIKDGKMIIELAFNATGTESKSGKSLVLASTNGNKAVALPDGTQIMVGVNAYKSK